MISTIVIAPIRKKRISEISPIFSAGVHSRILLHPIDCIKTRLQHIRTTVRCVAVCLLHQLALVKELVPLPLSSTRPSLFRSALLLLLHCPYPLPVHQCSIQLYCCSNLHHHRHTHCFSRRRNHPLHNPVGRCEYEKSNEQTGNKEQCRFTGKGCLLCGRF